MTILKSLLDDLPADLPAVDVYIGKNWTLAHLSDSDRAGVASTPQQIPQESVFHIGQRLHFSDRPSLADMLASHTNITATISVAVLNAVLQPPAEMLSDEDAADWLSAQSKGRCIAIFGRFPFVDDEIRPHAKQICVFEQQPTAGEYGANDMPHLLPQMDIVAITGSTIINHTLDAILSYVGATTTVVIMGPSTPLSPRLFTYGVDVLFGVRVIDTHATIQSAMAGDDFQKMRGLQRVSLFKANFL